MKHNILVMLLLGIITGSLSSCSEDFLNTTPSQILTEEQVFNDPNMISSVLANYYGRVNWGQNITNAGSYTSLDEASQSSGGASTEYGFGDAQWRVYDYDLIRNINQFLVSVRATTAMDKPNQLQAEGEARFLRAWVYFNMVKGLGGMPIVGDEVFEYNAGMDVTSLQIARSTEAEMYDYIIKECTEISAFMTKVKPNHAARATKWTALMLKARAAIYAASISKYNALNTPQIATVGGEVGIPSNRSKEYYAMALEAAKLVIDSSTYKLEDVIDQTKKAQNFYDACCVKDNNDEVILAKDYAYPGETHGFSTANTPVSVAEDIDRSAVTPVLNLVEAFEYINDRNGKLKLMDGNGDYIMYNFAEDVFANKDPRLWATVIYPGQKFKGKVIELQAGRKSLVAGKWKAEIGQPGAIDTITRATITSENGPTLTNNQYMNKTGFFFRKFLDETPQSATRGRGSDMWFPRFRFSEAILIAAEASLELDDAPNALIYLNKVRKRAGIQELTSITFDDIVQENRVEFAFENHRYWDLKRWRIADRVWNGDKEADNSTLKVLFPYVVNMPGNPNDGKWIFDKQNDRKGVRERNFQLKNYYNFLNQTWIDNNPKLVKNPFQ